MNMPPSVSPQEWEAAREELLVKEKELTRARDALAAERRRMPRMAVEKPYAFEGPNGPASLLEHRGVHRGSSSVRYSSTTSNSRPQRARWRSIQSAASLSTSGSSESW